MNINDKHLLFLATLRHALWNEEQGLDGMSEDSYEYVLHEADRQTVTGLVFEYFSSCGVVLPKGLIFKNVSVVQRIKQQNQKMNDSICKLTSFLEEAAIRYRIVKGQSIASYYTNPYLRQSGDVDFYCPPGDFEKAMEIIPNQLGITIGGYDSEHHRSFEYQGIHYELHFALGNLYNKQCNQYFHALVDEASYDTFGLNGKQINTLPPTLHCIYLFLHIYEHLMELGVGLRQFCDWAVILHACNHDIDHEAIKKHLKALGMEKAYRACGAVLVDYLGLPEKEYTYTLSKSDRRYAKKILDIVFYRGNMGKYNKRSGFKGWRHKVESMGIKTSHFVKFWTLAPKYSCNWFWHEFWRKI